MKRKTPTIKLMPMNMISVYPAIFYITKSLTISARIFELLRLMHDDVSTTPNRKYHFKYNKKISNIQALSACIFLVSTFWGF